jgi:hypothetical protein
MMLTGAEVRADFCRGLFRTALDFTSARKADAIESAF